VKAKPLTGHATVDAIGRIEHMFIGALSPYPWYSKILDKRKRPYHLAIALLAEIVGWYRPKYEVVKGNPVAHKKFKRERLQMSRGELARKFNTDEETISRALTFLEKRVGAIGRKLLDLNVGGRKYRNSLHVWPIPEVIEKLCETDKAKPESGTSTPEGMARITGATWPASQGPHTPDDPGDVAMHKSPRGRADPGDVAPTMGVGTVTGRETDRNPTTTNGKLHGANAPVVVAADCLYPEANLNDPETNKPTGQTAKPTPKPKVLTPASGAPRQPSSQMSTGGVDAGADASAEANADEIGNDPTDGNADRFIEFFQMAHKARFGTTAKVTAADRVAVRDLIRQGDWLVSDLVVVALTAWTKIGKTASDGKYNYPCCQHSQRISKFVQHFDRICSDTESGTIRDLSVEMVVQKIAKLTQFSPAEVEQFFAPELDKEAAAEAEPEMKLDDVPDPSAINIKNYVRENENIPIAWFDQKLIPHLTITKGALPAGKQEFLIRYWTLWRHYEQRHSKDAEGDYAEMHACQSRCFDDAGVRAELLLIVEKMFKEYRRWKQDEAGDRPTWPLLRNILAESSVKQILKL
jgi:hypothetical protein